MKDLCQAPGSATFPPMTTLPCLPIYFVSAACYAKECVSLIFQLAANVERSSIPMAVTSSLATVGQASDQETQFQPSTILMKLLRDLAERGSEANQISFSRLVSHWKRTLATTLQRENALFILNTSANILYASNRYTPNQDVLNESIHNS